MSRKHVRLAVAVAAGVTLASSAAASVALGTAGSITPVAGLSSLDAIACPTTKTCVVVGSDNSLNGKSAILTAATGAVKVWSGTVKEDPINAVACPSKTSCLAVADDAVATVKASSAATKVTATPKKPANGIVALGTIACPGATRCYAAGFEGTEANSHAIVLTLSSAGKLLALKKDKGTGISFVTCPSSSLCLISDHLSSGEVIQVLKSGKIGTSHPVPSNTYVQSLSCYRTSVCYALGGNGHSSDTNELFPVNPKTGKVGSKVKIKLNGDDMSCVSASTCLVAGFEGSGSTAKAAIVAIVHGKPQAPVLYTAGKNVSFHAIGCPSTSKCYAVGSSSSGAIVEKVKS